MATKQVAPMDSVDKIIAYEQGELDGEGTLGLFAELIASGLAWQLQGHYGRTAANLITSGYITRKGQITDKGYSALEN